MKSKMRIILSFLAVSCCFGVISCSDVGLLSNILQLDRNGLALLKMNQNTAASSFMYDLYFFSYYRKEGSVQWLRGLRVAN